ncbi:MAG: MAPEG family protein [Cellvibrionaceae bacterium]
MENNYIFIPVVIQVALTLWLYIHLAIAKSRAVRLGEVNEERRALHDDAWPNSVLQINNCIRNQFEVPVLFYVLIGILWGIGGINFYVYVAAWAFVLSRIGHAVIHTGSNYVPLRRKLFMVGCCIIAAITFYSAYKIVLI